MNRHERRKAKKINPFVDDYVLHLPEISPAEALSLSRRPGLTHVVMRHDSWCRVLTEGGGVGNCNCNPQISYHVEPARS